MLSITQATVTTFAIAAVIVVCRALPVILLGRSKGENRGLGVFIGFVERSVPPVAMTALAVVSLVSVDWSRPYGGVPELVAAAAVALAHLVWRNTLLSILGGTILYMAIRFLVQ